MMGFTKGMPLPLREDAVPNTDRETGALRLYVYQFVGEEFRVDEDAQQPKKQKVTIRTLNEMDTFSSQVGP